MLKRWKFLLLAFALILFTYVPEVFAASLPETNRDQIIENRFNCFTKRVTPEGIDWQDICANLPNEKQPEPESLEEPHSLDAMVKRLHKVADEMLAESVGDEWAAKDVDEVYQKHNKTHDNQRTVDDIISDYGLKNDFTSNVPSDKSADNEEKKIEADESGEDRVEKAESKNNLEKKGKTKDVFEGFDNTDFMEDSARDTTQVNFRAHTFDVGYERYYYEYKEDSLQVKLNGWWDAISAAYTYRPKQGDLLDLPWVNNYRIEGRYASAELDYSSGSTGTSEDDPNYMYETRILLGRDFYTAPKVVITPYIGYGYRFLVDDSGGKQTSTGQYSYDRKSHYHYIPIGLEYTYQLNKEWRVVGSAEGDIFLTGWQKSYLSDVPFPGYFDVRNDQDKGYGVRGSIKLIRATAFVNFTLEPFIRFWHIDDSDVANAGLIDGLEPENTTLESGLRAGLQF